MHLTDSHAHLDMFPDDLAPVPGARVGCRRPHHPRHRHRRRPAPDAPRARRSRKSSEANRRYCPLSTPAPASIPRRRTRPTRIPRQSRCARRERTRASPSAKSASTTTTSTTPQSAIQRAAFVAQMQVAAAARKPILIHCRTSELATPEAKAEVRPRPTPGRTSWSCSPSTGSPSTRRIPAGILHCFSGTHRAGPPLARPRLLSLLRRQPDLPQAASPARSRRRLRPPTASWSKPTRPSSRPSRTAASRTSPP